MTIMQYYVRSEAMTYYKKAKNRKKDANSVLKK